MNLFVIGVESGEYDRTDFSVEGRAFTTEAEAEEYAQRMNRENKKRAEPQRGSDARQYTVWPVEVA